MPFNEILTIIDPLHSHRSQIVRSWLNLIYSNSHKFRMICFAFFLLIVSSTIFNGENKCRNEILHVFFANILFKNLFIQRVAMACLLFPFFHTFSSQIDKIANSRCKLYAYTNKTTIFNLPIGDGKCCVNHSDIGHLFKFKGKYMSPDICSSIWIMENFALFGLSCHG